jgi:hypothetical protein
MVIGYHKSAIIFYNEKIRFIKSSDNYPNNGNLWIKKRFYSTHYSSNAFLHKRCKECNFVISTNKLKTNISSFSNNLYIETEILSVPFSKDYVLYASKNSEFMYRGVIKDLKNNSQDEFYLNFEELKKKIQAISLFI